MHSLITRFQKDLFTLIVLFSIINSNLSFAHKIEAAVENRFLTLLWNFENIVQPWRMDKDKSRKGKVGADISLNSAWRILDAAPSVKISVIDVEFDLKHPDLIEQFDLEKEYDCPLPKSKKILEESTDSLTVEWTLDNDTTLWTAHKPLEQNYKDYLNWVFSHTSMTSIDSLKSTILIREKVIEEMPDSNFKITLQKSNVILRKIVNGKIGELRRLSCIESIPFREYVRVPQRYFFMAEFIALMLMKEDQIKILTQFPNPKKLSNGGAVISKAMNDELNILLANNWRISHQLHNHPYFFDNPYGDFGGNLAPSNPDIKSSYEENIPEVLITNGIDSISLKHLEIEELYNFIK